MGAPGALDGDGDTAAVFDGATATVEISMPLEPSNQVLRKGDRIRVAPLVPKLRTGTTAACLLALCVGTGAVALGGDGADAARVVSGVPAFLLGALALWMLRRSVRVELYIDSSGLRVRNAFRDYEVTWEDIVGFEWIVVGLTWFRTQPEAVAVRVRGRAGRDPECLVPITATSSPKGRSRTLAALKAVGVDLSGLGEV